MDEDVPLIAPVNARKRLPFGRRLSYGVGHVLNDLCASMWFSYLLIYFHKVLGFTNSMAGGLLLLGQISDGICTPLIGYESDRTKSGVCNYGRRKTWHLVGTLCVICSFTFIYQPVFGTSNAEDWARFIYYAPFIVIFQFGWAATQISHLSLIPEITSEDGERVELNAIRYAFTVMSSIFVYLVTYLLLQLDQDDDQMVSSSLDPDDVPQFRYLVVIVVGLGTVFSIIFHVGTKEPKCGKRCCPDELDSSYGSIQENDEPRLKMKWSDWLKESQFYQVTALYMFTRLMVNIAQIYIPMYVTDTLGLTKQSLALVPLVVYISGFLSTLVAKPINRKAGRKMTYFLGAILYLAACIWMAIPDIGLQVYGSAILLGAGGSTVLVTSLAFTADLIGRNTESGAFVYGAMSFTDKVSNGIAVEVIQLLQPCVHCCPGCKTYYKAVMTYVTGASAICAIIVLATLIPVKIGNRRKKLLMNPSTADESHHSSSNNNPSSRQLSPDFLTGSSGSYEEEEPTRPNGHLPQSGDYSPSQITSACADVHGGLDVQAAKLCGKRIDPKENLVGHHENVHGGLDAQAAKLCGKRMDPEENPVGHREKLPDVSLITCNRRKTPAFSDGHTGHDEDNHVPSVASSGDRCSPHEVRT